MQIGNCRLLIHDNGSDVAVANVTPAEIVLLASEHTINVKKYPITDLKARPGQDAASIETAASYYDHTDEEVINNEKRVGDLKEKAAYRKRTDSEELVRLQRKYGEKKVKALWSDVSVTLPQTFDEAEKIVKSRVQTSPNLVDVTTSEATVPSAKGSPGAPPAPAPTPTLTSPISK